MMPRVYVKKLDAKREKVTVPVSVELLDKLKSYAYTIEVSYTQAARDLIAKGLDQEAANDKHSRTNSPL
jgi:hypothetical protein